MHLRAIPVLLLWSVLGLWAAVHASCRDPADPLEPVKPTLPGKPCTAFTLAEWTSQERWVWKQVCEGQFADFNKAEGNKIRLDPKKPDGWEEKRVLRQFFLETILLYEPWRGMVPRQGVRISGAWFKEPLNLSNAEIKHALVLHCSRFDAYVILLGLRTTRFLLFDDSAFKAHLNMSGIRVEDALLMRDAQFTSVRLRGAHIGNQLSLTNTMVTGWLEMDSLEVGRSLMMERAQFTNVSLFGTHINGQLSLINTTVTGILEMSALSTESSLLMLTRKEYFTDKRAHFADVHLSGVHIGGHLILSGTPVTGTLKINSSEVEGRLDLSDALLPSLDLTGSRIGELRLARKSLVTRWRPKATLTLWSVTAGAIQDAHNAWPDTLELNGFTYGRWVGFTGGETHDVMHQRDVGWFIEWLSKQAEYSPQPYEYLAKVLYEEGHKAAAREILYAGKERERSKACRSKNPRQPDACDLSELPWLWLSILKVFIGYGYYVGFTFRWAIGATIIGMGVLKISGQGQKHKMKYCGLAYSIDMLLPIVELRRYHFDKIDLEGWARVYFYCHKVFGYVLALFLAAGLTGLVK